MSIIADQSGSALLDIADKKHVGLITLQSNGLFVILPVSNIAEDQMKKTFMIFSGQIGYLIRSNLDYFVDVTCNPLDPTFYFISSEESVSARNITKTYQ